MTPPSPTTTTTNKQRPDWFILYASNKRRIFHLAIMIKLSLLDIILNYEFFHITNFSFFPVEKWGGCQIMLTQMLISFKILFTHIEYLRGALKSLAHASAGIGCAL